jgi:hypothetical protein
MLEPLPPDFEPPSQAEITSKKDNAERTFPMSQGTTMSKTSQNGPGILSGRRRAVCRRERCQRLMGRARFFRAGQFDDLETPAHRILHDDEPSTRDV